MVQPLILSTILLTGALSLGCLNLPHGGVVDDSDDPWSHRTLTAWAPLPSADGSRLAFVLEPRRVDAQGEGVMVTGWKGQVAGEGLVVTTSAAGVGDVLAHVPRGFQVADRTEGTLFVWSLDAAEWTPIAPNDPPPLDARYAHLARFDRANFAPLGERAFDPPLEHPYAIGDTTILDVPRPSSSDLVRPVKVALYDATTGASTTLHEARGFRVAACARNGGVTVAYQPEGATATTVVLDVTTSGRVARMDLADLTLDDLTCRALAEVAVVHGSVDGATRSRVLRRDGDALSVVFDVPAGRPAAISRDGKTLLASRAAGTVALFTADGVVQGPSLEATAAPTVSLDRALVVGKAGMSLVRLDGATPAFTAVSGTATTTNVFSAGDGGFFAVDTTYVKMDPVVSARFVSDTGATELPVAAAYADLGVVYADGTHAYLVGQRVGDDPKGVDLLTVDVAQRRVVATAPFPLCDRTAIRAQGRCLP